MQNEAVQSLLVRTTKNLLAKIDDLQHFGAGQMWCRKKNEPTLLYSALIKKKFMCEVNSLAFNRNLLHWEHDCIFVLPLRSSVNHYYKQVISAQSQ